MASNRIMHPNLLAHHHINHRSGHLRLLVPHKHLHLPPDRCSCDNAVSTVNQPRYPTPNNLSVQHPSLRYESDKDLLQIPSRMPQ